MEANPNKLFVAVKQSQIGKNWMVEEKNDVTLYLLEYILIQLLLSCATQIHDTSNKHIRYFPTASKTYHKLTWLFSTFRTDESITTNIRLMMSVINYYIKSAFKLILNTDEYKRQRGIVVLLKYREGRFKMASYK